MYAYEGACVTVRLDEEDFLEDRRLAPWMKWLLKRAIITNKRLCIRHCRREIVKFDQRVSNDDLLYVIYKVDEFVKDKTTAEFLTCSSQTIRRAAAIRGKREKYEH